MMDDCAILTEERLKLVHTFDIGLTALRYRTTRAARVIWPNQYTWLLQQGLERQCIMRLSEKNTGDKANTNGSAKLLALGGVS